MKNKFLIFLSISYLTIFISCSQNNSKLATNTEEKTIDKVNITQTKPHEYGGWYCPDNLNGFPALDINSWENVPVVNGRLPTEEETQSGSSLIFVDVEKYPNAKALDIHLPKLAKFYNKHSKKDELVIVIQAINVLNDSIVGFRYLNGGNGSARINEVIFLSENEINKIPSSHFVSLNIQINATQNEIWEVLTKAEYSKDLQPIFDEDNKLNADWNKSSKVNFKYLNEGNTSDFAANLYGNQYIQIDWEVDDYQYVEKFLLLENKEAKTTDFSIVCGPYNDDFMSQKLILNRWAQRVKELSEKDSKWHDNINYGSN